jgi:hypothetical protein
MLQEMSTCSGLFYGQGAAMQGCATGHAFRSVSLLAMHASMYKYFKKITYVIVNKVKKSKQPFALFGRPCNGCPSSNTTGNWMILLTVIYAYSDDIGMEFCYYFEIRYLHSLTAFVDRKTVQQHPNNNRSYGGALWESNYPWKVSMRYASLPRSIICVFSDGRPTVCLRPGVAVPVLQ